MTRLTISASANGGSCHSLKRAKVRTKVMRKMLFATAILPLLGGVALAGPGGTGGSPNVGHNVDTSAGPTAYANAQQLWEAQQKNTTASVVNGWLLPNTDEPHG